MQVWAAFHRNQQINPMIEFFLPSSSPKSNALEEKEVAMSPMRSRSKPKKKFKTKIKKKFLNNLALLVSWLFKLPWKCEHKHTKKMKTKTLWGYEKKCF